MAPVELGMVVEDSDPTDAAHTLVEPVTAPRNASDTRCHSELRLTVSCSRHPLVCPSALCCIRSALIGAIFAQPEPRHRCPVESLRLRHCFVTPALPLKCAPRRPLAPPPPSTRPGATPGRPSPSLARPPLTVACSAAPRRPLPGRARPAPHRPSPFLACRPSPSLAPRPDTPRPQRPRPSPPPLTVPLAVAPRRPPRCALAAPAPLTMPPATPSPTRRRAVHAAVP
eukprot:XP_020395588.1 vegetative cell wall protein gp1-like [Zea mays]